jgi:hypothetical protein
VPVPGRSFGVAFLLTHAGEEAGEAAAGLVGDAAGEGCHGVHAALRKSSRISHEAVSDQPLPQKKRASGRRPASGDWLLGGGV